jgi:hypothetical protein
MSEHYTSNFIFSIARIPDVVYSLQTVNLPSISLSGTLVPSPVLDYPIPGDKITFGTLSFSFIVDEDLTNYIALYNWMIEIAGLKRDEKPVHSDVQSATSDGTLTILTNNKNPITSVRYVDCFPSNISDIQYNSTTTDVVTVDVTMEYSYWEFRK